MSVKFLVCLNSERAGWSILDIYQVWQDNKWVEPVIEESFNPDRTKLALKFIEKTSEQNKRTKTDENIELIRDFLHENGISKTSDIANVIGLSPARTRVILNSMPDVIYEGETNQRKYGIKTVNNLQHWILHFMQAIANF